MLETNDYAETRCVVSSEQVRDSVMDAVAEAPESLCFKPGMETVVDTLFKDVAKDLVNVSLSQVQAQQLRQLPPFVSAKKAHETARLDAHFIISPRCLLCHQFSTTLSLIDFDAPNSLRSLRHILDAHWCRRYLQVSLSPQRRVY